MSAGPLRRVLDELGKGARSRAELADRTGLSPELVDSCVEHLLRTGVLAAEQLGRGCPDTGCGSCPSGTADGRAGCGSSGPTTSRGPVAITLRTRAT